MWNLSLKNRLRLPIIVLAAFIATAMSVVNIQSLAEAKFSDVADRAQVVAKQVESFLIERVTERTAALEERPTDIDQSIELWTAMVARDPEVPRMLEQTIASTSDALVEIWVADRAGQVLTSTNQARIGGLKPTLRSVSAWRDEGLWAMMREVVFGGLQDRVHEVQLGSGDTVAFQVGVVVSAALLRNSVLPQVNGLALLSGTAILLALLVAFIVSKIAIRPLEQVGEMLDRLTTEEPKPEEKTRAETAELAALESKLMVIGQQMRGAKQGVSQLRSDIDQMLHRLEGAVLLFDQNDELVIAGGGVERMLGKHRWEMPGRKLADLFPADSRLGAALQSAFALRRPLNDRVLVYEESSGTSLRLAVTVEILEQFSPGSPRGTLVTLRDAESRQQIGSQLDIAARLAAINRLTSGVAHEIKNPLNSIALHAEILKALLDPSNEEGKEEIEIISREIARLDRVVKTFLDFTRPVELQLEEVDLRAVVEELGNLIATSAAVRNIDLSLVLTPEVATIRADRDLIKQAILNILMNGIEAMPDGGELSVKLNRQDGEWLLAIADTGGGIPPEIQSKIFNLYFTTKQTGTGIGLAMTFRFIQLHSARIDFSTTLGRGTTFRIHFPAAAAESRVAMADSISQASGPA